jgi:general stress protein YciG
MANNQGFASMDADKQRKIASEGGKASSGNFANDKQKASEAGKKGAAAQPTEAKAKGGHNSHSNQ